MFIDLYYSHHFSVIFLSDENQIKAGQLNVMQALVEMMTVHKANAAVAQQAAGALRNICVNGVVLFRDHNFCFFKISRLYTFFLLIYFVTFESY